MSVYTSFFTIIIIKTTINLHIYSQSETFRTKNKTQNTYTQHIPTSILRFSYNLNFQEAINKMLDFSNKHKHRLMVTN